MNEDVAVIIPTRDRAELLEATLASLARQDQAGFETIVADHGSADRTTDVLKEWSGKLVLRHALLSPERRSPGWVRDEGVRHTAAGTLVFLDCGMLIPSGFVQAHREHHRAGSRVGIGMCHGYRVFGRQEKMPAGTESSPEFKERLEADIELRDERFGMSSSELLGIPWIYGWSGNLSVGRDLYTRAGGFDRDRACGYEDIDFAYRLHAHGGRFTLVDQGWAFHLPHPTTPIGERLRSTQAGWHLTYSVHRSLSLESAGLALPHPLTWRRLAPHYGPHIDAMMRLLEQSTAVAAPVAVSARQLGIAGPSLLVGGTPADAGQFDYVACGRRDLASTDRVWGCAGILIPLPARTLRCVAVTDMWRRLGATAGRLRLLDYLVAEVARVAEEVIFLDSGRGSPPGSLTPDDLATACDKRGVRWSLR